MEDRPKIQIELNSQDKTIELLGWIAIMALWILTLINYSDLPETIPTHYNGAGEADDFGGRSTILSLPIIGTVIFALLTALNKFPHVFNYPVSITNENALKQYRIAARLIRYLKLIIVIIFGLLVFKTIQISKGQIEGLGIWFLPLTMSLIFIPLIIFIVKSRNNK